MALTISQEQVNHVMYHSPVTHVGNVAAVTVTVASIVNMLPAIASLFTIVWLGLQIINIFQEYIKNKRVVVLTQGKVGPTGPQGMPGVDAITDPAINLRLDQIHDLVNSQAEELKAAIAKIEFAAGRQAEREHPTKNG